MECIFCTFVHVVKINQQLHLMYKSFLKIVFLTSSLFCLSTWVSSRQRIATSLLATLLTSYCYKLYEFCYMVTYSTPLMFPDKQLCWDIIADLVEFNKQLFWHAVCLVKPATFFLSNYTHKPDSHVKCCTMVDERADTQSRVCNLT